MIRAEGADVVIWGLLCGYREPGCRDCCNLVFQELQKPLRFGMYRGVCCEGGGLKRFHRVKTCV